MLEVPQVAGPPANERTRQRAAHLLAAALSAQAIISATAFALAYVAPAWERQMSAAATVPLAVLAIVAALAAAMEWTRARFAEAVAVAAAGLGTWLTLFEIMSARWLVGPMLGVATLTVLLRLAERYAVRDEVRHLPRTAL